MDRSLEKYGKDVIYLATIIMLTLFVSISSFSYAVLTKDLVGEKKYSIQIGMFDFEMQNEQNSIRLLNAYPMTEEEGKTLEPYRFTITNTGDYEEDYKVYLIEVEEEKGNCQNCTFLEPEKLQYILTVDGVEKPTQWMKSKTLLENGVLEAGKTKNYELRVWLNYDATVEEENKVYYGKIQVEATQRDQNAINRVSEKTFLTENLGENCKTYNDGIDTFLVGQCSQNYVWYSGKLWRVVLKNNETGAVKMVTDDIMTTIAYNEQNNSTFNNSYVDQWLNQEFLPTLHDYENYLIIDSNWDILQDNSTTPVRPSKPTKISRTIGLLNSYEYYTTYYKSDGLATNISTYLYHNVQSWLMNQTENNMACIITTGSGLYCNFYNTAEGLGVQPAINLKSEIQISSGIGTKEDPYKLAGDMQETVNGTTLLSTRYSGEYIKFNNELYRIVGVEDEKTKIVAMNIPSGLESKTFHSDDSIVSFENASIKTELETYYQNSVVEPYKSMIEPNAIWYLGAVIYGANYKASICNTVDSAIGTKMCPKTSAQATATIGLPRVGELFSSTVMNGANDFWLLTPNQKYVRVERTGFLSYVVPTTLFAVRPSMYLKSNIVIASTNTGDGTYEHPYDIELGK